MTRTEWSRIRDKAEDLLLSEGAASVKIKAPSLRSDEDGVSEANQVADLALQSGLNITSHKNY